jgi:hypothetical protein
VIAILSMAICESFRNPSRREGLASTRNESASTPGFVVGGRIAAAGRSEN